MKKLLFLLSITFCSFLLNAQSLTSKEFTISISDLKVDERERKIADEMILKMSCEGSYIIIKNGKEIANQKFSASKMTTTYNGDTTLSVKIKNYAGQGNTVIYDYDAKKLDLYGKKEKAIKYKNTSEIILSSILFYAKELLDK